MKKNVREERDAALAREAELVEALRKIDAVAVASNSRKIATDALADHARATAKKGRNADDRQD